MRKVLINFAIFVALVVAMAVLWISRGRSISLLIESFGTIELRSVPIKSISYEGNASGGVLHVNAFAFELTPARSDGSVPEIGTSKDGQVALSYRGKVFSFGQPSASGDDNLATAPMAGDEAKIEMRRSIVAWPNPFEVNFMTGQSPSWKRFSYQRLTWKKSNGPRLEMMWRCEQFLYPNNDWSEACMTDPGITGLIHVEISSAAR